jgi:hypothetical protein
MFKTQSKNEAITELKNMYPQSDPFPTIADQSNLGPSLPRFRPPSFASHHFFAIAIPLTY